MEQGIPQEFLAKTRYITTGSLYKDCLNGIGGVHIDEELSIGTVVNGELLGNSERHAGGQAPSIAGKCLSTMFQRRRKESRRGSRRTRSLIKSGL